MRIPRNLLAGVLVVALAVIAPPVMAQAPAPRVTINGLVDTLTSYTRNLSLEDLSYTRTADREWYARTRVRPDITAEVGTTRFVLGLEIDYAFGSSGTSPAKQRFGVTEGTPLNTDIGKATTDAGSPIVEMKWAYTEFDAPLLPFNVRIRLGAQPFAATYKTSVLAGGDFAGVNLDASFSPQIKGHFTYAQLSSRLSGVQEGFFPDSYALAASVELSPIKGVDLRPTFGKAYLDGPASTAVRQGRGGISSAGFVPGDLEKRYTVGLDARIGLGPMYVDPTFFYQFGFRDSHVKNQPEARESAWFVDVRGGYQIGPLLLEAAGVYTTGNKASDDITNGRTPVKFYQPIDTDTSYYTGWAEIWALGIDYFNILYARAPGLNPGVAVGYDKYGLVRVGLRPSYSITPDLALRAAVTANWTDQKVDTDGTIDPVSGITPARRPGEARPEGDARYLGTELDLGLTWRFAPNVALDVVGAYLWSGEALASARTTPDAPTRLPATIPNSHPKDIQAVTARVRYTF